MTRAGQIDPNFNRQVGDRTYSGGSHQYKENDRQRTHVDPAIEANSESAGRSSLPTLPYSRQLCPHRNITAVTGVGTARSSQVIYSAKFERVQLSS